MIWKNGRVLALLQGAARFLIQFPNGFLRFNRSPGYPRVGQARWLLELKGDIRSVSSSLLSAH